MKKLNTLLLLTALLIYLPLISSAQKKVISGRCIYQATGKPFINGLIYINGFELKTKAIIRSDGKFDIIIPDDPAIRKSREGKLYLVALRSNELDKIKYFRANPKAKNVLSVILTKQEQAKQLAVNEKTSSREQASGIRQPSVLEKDSTTEIVAETDKNSTSTNTNDGTFVPAPPLSNEPEGNNPLVSDLGSPVPELIEPNEEVKESLPIFPIKDEQIKNNAKRFLASIDEMNTVESEDDIVKLLIEVTSLRAQLDSILIEYANYRAEFGESGVDSNNNLFLINKKEMEIRQLKENILQKEQEIIALTQVNEKLILSIEKLILSIILLIIVILIFIALLIKIFRQKKEISLLHDSLEHRVKDALKGMLAMIINEKDKTQFIETKSTLTKFECSLKAILSVEQQLIDNYYKDDEIRLQDFLKKLIGDTHDIFDNDKRRVERDIQLDNAPITTTGQTAKYLGFIIVELIFNAYRYAFPKIQNECKITVGSYIEGKQYVFKIVDNGLISFQESRQSHKRSGTGLKKAYKWASKIQGKFIEPELGSKEFKICFDLNKFTNI